MTRSPKVTRVYGPLLPTLTDVDHARDVWMGYAQTHGPDSAQANDAWDHWTQTSLAMLNFVNWREQHDAETAGQQEARK